MDSNRTNLQTVSNVLISFRPQCLDEKTIGARQNKRKTTYRADAIMGNTLASLISTASSGHCSALI
uniref:Kinesin motor domain-containing protein n=1 Tax=Heterorhabditis bacteriophora TaxID=37862 RepID=A0A1I7XLS3_HETBA